MATEETIRVQGLVVFPAFRVQIDVTNQDVLNQLEELQELGNHLPIVKQVGDQVLKELLLNIRRNQAVQEWAKIHRPALWDMIQKTYHLEKHHD